MRVTRGIAEQEGGRKYRAPWFAAVARHHAKVLWSRLPAPIKASTIRRRHLRHVTEQMPAWIHPAYLGDSDYSCEWLLSPDKRPVDWPLVPWDLLGFEAWNESDKVLAKEWLSGGPWDSDEFLEARLDNHDDELGRTVAALRTRLVLASIEGEHSQEMLSNGRGGRGSVLMRGVCSPRPLGLGGLVDLPHPWFRLRGRQPGMTG